MANDDYDLLPHSELKKLEEEIHSLKSASTGTKNSSQDSMEKLAISLNSMISIFNDAKNELRIEDEEKELLSKKIDPMIANLKTILEHNEKIAEGILSVADMIKTLEMKVIGLDAKLNRISEIQQKQAEESFSQSSANAAPLTSNAMNPAQSQMPSQDMSWQTQNMPPQRMAMQQATPNFDANDPFKAQSSGFGTNSAADPFGAPLVQNQNPPAFGAPQGYNPPQQNPGFYQNQAPQQQPNAFGPPPSFGNSGFGNEQAPASPGQNLPPPPPRPSQKKGFFK